MPPDDTYLTPLNWLRDNAIPILSAVFVLAAGWYLSRLVYRLIKRLLPRAHGVDKNFAPLTAQARAMASLSLRW